MSERREITLYPASSGLFYEDATPSSLLITRHPGDGSWAGYLYGRPGPFIGKTAEDVIRKITAEQPVQITVDRSQEWSGPVPGGTIHLRASTGRAQHAIAPEDLTEVVLYKGDNGAHVFYETAKGEHPHLLILRNHGSRPWIAMLEDREIGPSGKNPEDVIRKLTDERPLRIRIDQEREWRYLRPHHLVPELVAVDRVLPQHAGESQRRRNSAFSLIFEPVW